MAVIASTIATISRCMSEEAGAIKDTRKRNRTVHPTFAAFSASFRRRLKASRSSLFITFDK